MKKKLLFVLVSILLSTGTFAATTVAWFPPVANNIGYDSARLVYKVTATSFTGNHKERFLVKKMADSTWMKADSLTTSVINLNRSLSAHDLMSATTYMYAVTVYNDTSSTRDTVICPLYTFTTKPYPVFPTVTIQEIPKAGISELKINAVLTGTSDSFYIYANHGDLFQNYSDTIRANSTTTGTLHLITPNAQDEIQYCIWIHSDLLGDRLMNCDSFITPVFSRGAITNVTKASGVDTIAVNATVSMGTFAGTLKFILKDSAGTTLQTSATVSVNTSGSYPYVFRNLIGNKFYRFEIAFKDSVGVDTTRGSIRTSPYVFGSISNTSATAYIDSFRIFATITLGTFHANIKFVKKDSVGNVLQTSPTIQVNVNGIYSYAFAASQGTLYKFAIIINDSVHVDSIPGAIRTLYRVLMPAPVGYFKTSPAPVTFCGRIDIAGYVITGTGRAAIIRAFNDSNVVNMSDTTRSFPVSGTINQGVFSESAPRTGGRYYWRIVTWSTDGVMAVSAAISAPTYNEGSDPNYLVTPVGFSTSPTPTLQISGDAFCVSTVLYFTYYNTTTGQTFMDTIDVGYGTTNALSIPFNHPPGDYDISYNLRTANGLSITITLPRIKRSNITTGIRNNTLEKVRVGPIPSNGLIAITGIDNGDVVIMSLSGQTVFTGIVSDQIDLTGFSRGIYFLYIKNEEGEAKIKIEVQ